MQSRSASSVAPSGKAAQRGGGARTGDAEVIDRARVTLTLLGNGVIL
ncbi:hypothetical protein ABR737_33635 [Streptomyces sp. Edi2]